MRRGPTAPEYGIIDLLYVNHTNVRGANLVLSLI
eukprot:SAG31_NODE_19788_length_591_cov_1.245935_1_plen_33_part_10